MKYDFTDRVTPFQVCSGAHCAKSLCPGYRIDSVRGERVRFQQRERFLIDVRISSPHKDAAAILMIEYVDEAETRFLFPDSLMGIEPEQLKSLSRELRRNIDAERVGGKLPRNFFRSHDDQHSAHYAVRERLVPGLAPYGTLTAHLQRYLFAKQFASVDKTVLDLGCGGGYGLAILGINRGLGVDISSDAIAGARSAYGKPGIQYEIHDIKNLSLQRRFDLVTCFEVIEHLIDHQDLLDAIANHILPQGYFILSVPNPVYHGTDKNRYHMRDFTTDHLSALFGNHFETVQYYHQPHDIHGDLAERYLIRGGLDPSAEFWIATGCGPKPMRPRYQASIIIPLFNEVQYTTACLDAIATHTGLDQEYEVVVVDNGSTDRTAELLSELSGDVVVWRNQANLGFAKACNQGALLARGETLVFLNNDTEVHSGWLPPLLEELELNADTGVVGARLLYPDGTIQHAGVAIGRDQLPFHIHRNLPADHVLVSDRREFPIVTAACAAVRRTEFYEIGMFDEEFVNGHEDIDLCLRYRKQGLKIIYRPDCVVTHHESVSDGRMLARPQNLARTFKKWRYDLIQDDFRFKYPASTQREAAEPIRFAIKMGTPDRTQAHWGDIYYAESFAKALERAGHRCQIHYLNEWGSDDLDLDVVIHLKGLSEYYPKPYNLNIMWMLNHPSLHSMEELSRYDAILVASIPHAKELKKALKLPVFPFLQATDPEHFQPDPVEEKAYDLLFVGNNIGADRLAMRRIIADLLPTPYKLAVWGQGWKRKLPEGVWKGEFIPWEELPKAYRMTRIVLNDHQPEMKDYGFVNNRTFDAIATGAVVVSDQVKELGRVLPVLSYKDRNDLERLISSILNNEADVQRQVEVLRNKVLKEFTFDRRVQELLEVIARIRKPRHRPRGTSREGALSFVTDEKALVSVLMGTYNRKQFLPAAIDSIRAQNYSHWELVLVNDGGESVEDIVRGANDERIRLINLKTNRGKPAAINIGFRESRGAFVAYLDDDDIWYPDHLERLLLPLATIPGVEMAYSDAYDVWLKENADHSYSEIDRKLRYYRQVVFESLLKQNYIQGMVVVHRRELFEKAGGMDEKLKILIDWDMWRRLAALTYPYHVSRITADHFFRQSNETTGKGQISNIARANRARFEANRLRIIFKRFQSKTEMDFAEKLDAIRREALLNFHTAKGERAGASGEIEKARRSYRISSQLFPNDPIPLRNYAMFELFHGDPYIASGIMDRCIAVCSQNKIFSFADAMYSAILKMKMGETQTALCLLDFIDRQVNAEEAKNLTQHYREKALAA
jgi:GT2 family glycosyltransferase/2-polyprenyl-3-methyl-5-hydroxy-6-metoxy-1,4-benzoquinol methylase